MEAGKQGRVHNLLDRSAQAVNEELLLNCAQYLVESMSVDRRRRRVTLPPLLKRLRSLCFKREVFLRADWKIKRLTWRKTHTSTFEGFCTCKSLSGPESSVGRASSDPFA